MGTITIPYPETGQLRRIDFKRWLPAT